jgi:hypothetical protein
MPRRVGISADHQAARQPASLEDNLVDDARSGFPKTQPELPSRGDQEVVNLEMISPGGGRILPGFVGDADEVIAIDGGFDLGARNPGRDELQKRHLSGDILHIEPIGIEIIVRVASFELVRLELDFLLLGRMLPRKQDLLRQEQRPAQGLASELDAGVGARVKILERGVNRVHGYL